jgi:pimeloyl-ACP methyl ester carboxylesterase
MSFDEPLPNMARARGRRGASGMNMGMSLRRLVLTSAVLLALSGEAGAGERLGIVFIHGKQGVPEQFASYERPLADEGYLLERPEMCWSRQRIYDRRYLDCLRDIDAAMERLRARGASGLVVAGQSLGGNAALAYGATRSGLKGVIALAPAHPPELLARRPEIATSIEKARALIAQGRGDGNATFNEINTRGSRVMFTVTTTPNIYLSFHGSDSPAVMPANAARLTAPLLIVAGTGDPTQRGPDYIFAKAPADRLNRYVAVNSDHLGTPAAAREAVIAWLNEVAAR